MDLISEIQSRAQLWMYRNWWVYKNKGMTFTTIVIGVIGDCVMGIPTKKLQMHNWSNLCLKKPRKQNPQIVNWGGGGAAGGAADPH